MGDKAPCASPEFRIVNLDSQYSRSYLYNLSAVIESQSVVLLMLMLH
jgi:hypothetical protein